MGSLMLGGTLLILALVQLGFALSLTFRRADVADVLWGANAVLLQLFLLMAGSASSRSLLVALLVGIWGLRLSLSIGLRNWGRPEDFRYRKWRGEWGEGFLLRSYLQVFLLQGGILLVVCAPLFALAASTAPPLDGWVFIGVLLWGIGFGLEVVADEELRRFRQDPANTGRTLMTGLRRWSRHPNYFGEALLWWGIGLIALPTSGGWVALVGPLLLTFLLLRVSGVPMMEGRLQRDPEFDAYRARTSAFLPLPPRNGNRSWS